MKLPIIKAKNFILRPYQAGDEPSLREHINNKAISRNTSHIPYPYTKKDAQEWVNKNLKEQKVKHPQGINFALCVQERVVGGIGLDDIRIRHKAEIGYWLGEKFWGQGIMTKTVKLVCKFGFEELGLHRIFACVYPQNTGSMRVLEKSGFEFEGIFKKHIKKGDQFIDCHIFAKTN